MDNNDIKSIDIKKHKVSIDRTTNELHNLQNINRFKLIYLFFRKLFVRLYNNIRNYFKINKTLSWMLVISLTTIVFGYVALHILHYIAFEL